MLFILTVLFFIAVGGLAAEYSGTASGLLYGAALVTVIAYVLTHSPV